MNEITDIALPTPGLGHNRPPGPLTPDQIRLHLVDDHQTLCARRDQLVSVAAEFLRKYPSIETEDVAAAAVQNLDMLAKHRRQVEDARKIAKEPYLEGCRAVDAWFRTIDADLATAHGNLSKPATAFAEQLAARRRAAAEAEARRLREVAERAEQEARDSGRFDAAIAAAQDAEHAAEQAAGKPAEHSRIVGTYGSTASLVETYDFEIEDVDKLPRRYLVPDTAAIRRAVTAGARTIPGLRIFPVRKLRTR